MKEAYVYDHVRTARGRGKADGALQEITPNQLGTQVPQAIRDRNTLNTSFIDDIVFGTATIIERV